MDKMHRNTDFTAEVIREIRKRWDDRTINVRETAAFYGKSAETIRRIGRRETHVGISGPVDTGEDMRVAQGDSMGLREKNLVAASALSALEVQRRLAENAPEAVEARHAGWRGEMVKVGKGLSEETIALARTFGATGERSLTEDTEEPGKPYERIGNALD